MAYKAMECLSSSLLASAFSARAAPGEMPYTHAEPQGWATATASSISRETAYGWVSPPSVQTPDNTLRHRRGLAPAFLLAYCNQFSYLFRNSYFRDLSSSALLLFTASAVALQSPISTRKQPLLRAQ